MSAPLAIQLPFTLDSSEEALRAFVAEFVSETVARAATPDEVNGYLGLQQTWYLAYAFNELAGLIEVAARKWREPLVIDDLCLNFVTPEIPVLALMEVLSESWNIPRHGVIGAFSPEADYAPDDIEQWLSGVPGSKAIRPEAVERWLRKRRAPLCLHKQPHWPERRSRRGRPGRRVDPNMRAGTWITYIASWITGSDKAGVELCRLRIARLFSWDGSTPTEEVKKYRKAKDRLMNQLREELPEFLKESTVQPLSLPIETSRVLRAWTIRNSAWVLEGIIRRLARVSVEPYSHDGFTEWLRRSLPLRFQSPPDDLASFGSPAPRR